MAASAEAH